jgi:hypothetical protein
VIAAAPGWYFGRAVTRDLEGDLPRHAGVIEPSPHGVSGIMQTDRLELRLSPGLFRNRTSNLGPGRDHLLAGRRDRAVSGDSAGFSRR